MLSGLTYGLNLIRDSMAGLMSGFDSPKARFWLAVFAMTETHFIARRQSGNGPARGLWQFEHAGGVRAVMGHRTTGPLLRAACALRHVKFDELEIWSALEFDDVLACVLARLLLLSDPYTLPEIDDVDGGWDLYAIRCWRPGKPHRADFNDHHATVRRLAGV